jgi:hypothetical protein
LFSSLSTGVQEGYPDVFAEVSLIRSLVKNKSTALKVKELFDFKSVAFVPVVMVWYEEIGFVCFNSRSSVLGHLRTEMKSSQYISNWSRYDGLAQA